MQIPPSFYGRLASQEMQPMLASAGWTTSLAAKWLVSTSIIVITRVTRVQTEAEPYTGVSVETVTFGQTFGPDEKAR